MEPSEPENAPGKAGNVVKPSPTGSNLKGYQGAWNHSSFKLLSFDNNVPISDFQSRSFQIQSMHPPRKRGPPIKANLPLVIPTIPSISPNASEYAPRTPLTTSGALLPSFLLPSPITPTLNPAFSHSQPPVHMPKKSSSERIERAMDVILDELVYSSVAEFFLSYTQQIPRGSSETFSQRHRNSL